MDKYSGKHNIPSGFRKKKNRAVILKTKPWCCQEKVHYKNCSSPDFVWVMQCALKINIKKLKIYIVRTVQTQLLHINTLA